jgi:hypothetical protein
MGLNERILELEQQVAALLSKVADLSKNVEETYKKPISVVGGINNKSTAHPSDIITGMGNQFGGMMVWNDAELKIPPFGIELPMPERGYAKHTHSRFSGGALIINGLEIVEYDDGQINNVHSQAFFATEPRIKKAINSNGQSVDMIGLLDLSFNADTGKWTIATSEIDIKKCVFVERDNDGNIIHSAPLYNADTTKTSIVWDTNGGCWRLYAAWAPGSGV